MLTAEDMQSFKENLLKRREEILHNLDSSQRKIEMMRNQDPKDEGDFALLSAETDLDHRIIEQQKRELAEIDIALNKIKDGSYGICEMCEEPIGKERLIVKNYARYCISCRHIIERERN